MVEDKWKPYKELTEVIQECLDSDWKWWMNSECKYVNIRIDMRDGHARLLNRDGKAIEIEDLKRQ